MEQSIVIHQAGIPQCLVNETELLMQNIYLASLECPPLYALGLKSDGLQVN